jgi:hypothetical protein
MPRSLLLAALCTLTVQAQPRTPFSALGATWFGDPAAVIAVRSSPDGLTWSAWKELRADSDIEPSPGGRLAGALLYMGEAQRYHEHRILAGAPTGLEFHFIDPGSSETKKTSSARTAGGTPIVTREEWSCPNPAGPASKSYAPVTHLIVHHTADSPPPGGNFAAWVRAIWLYHVNVNGWADIGYNFLVAPDGTIFEGRAGGPGVIGAHFSCVNTGTLGVAVLGTYTSQRPAIPAWLTLTRFLSSTATSLQLDPLAKAPHNASQLNLAVISGHRDSAGSPRACGTTECPGNTLYPLLPNLRADALFNWTPTGLWHLAPDSEWRYADPATNTYDTGAEPNSGTLESAPLVLPAGATLSFQSWFETENTTTVYDEKYVEASIDGGPWRALLQISGQPRTWSTYTAPLPASTTIRLRFRFDSVDATLNQFAGWSVSQIRLILD